MRNCLRTIEEIVGMIKRFEIVTVPAHEVREVIWEANKYMPVDMTVVGVYHGDYYALKMVKVWPENKEATP